MEKASVVTISKQSHSGGPLDKTAFHVIGRD